MLFTLDNYHGVALAVEGDVEEGEWPTNVVHRSECPLLLIGWSSVVLLRPRHVFLFLSASARSVYDTKARSFYRAHTKQRSSGQDIC